MENGNIQLIRYLENDNATQLVDRNLKGISKNTLFSISN
jgi:hypothetical protein